MKFKIISLTLIFFTVLIIVWGIYMIHMYPGKIAKKRKHPQFKAIEVTSVMGLLIFPLWIAALIWAYSNAIIGKLYNGGDFEEKQEVANAASPSAPVQPATPENKKTENKA